MNRLPWLDGVALLAAAVAVAACSPGASASPPSSGAPVAAGPSAAAVVSASAASAAPSPVPWIDATPAPFVPPTPSPLPPVPPGTPDCVPGDLVGHAGYQGATGSMLGGIEVTSHATHACAFPLLPPVSIEGSLAGTLPVTERLATVGTDAQTPTPPPAGARLLLPSGARAWMQIQWFNWCDRRPVGDVTFRVALRGGTLVAPAELPGEGAADATPMLLDETPRCDAPGGGSVLAVTPFAPVPDAAPSPTPSPIARLQVALLAPSTAVRGALLRYAVRVANPGPTPVALDPCPAYLEWLLPSSGGTAGKELHLLNCGPVRVVGPGEAVTFAMVLAVASDAAAGPATLYWELAGVDVPPEAKADTAIVAP